jgi:hypothetical protein
VTRDRTGASTARRSQRLALPGVRRRRKRLGGTREPLSGWVRAGSLARDSGSVDWIRGVACDGVPLRTRARERAPHSAFVQRPTPASHPITSPPPQQPPTTSTDLLLWPGRNPGTPPQTGKNEETQCRPARARVAGYGGPVFVERALLLFALVAWGAPRLFFFYLS